MEGLIFVLAALAVGALGVAIGILVAPRITRFAERADVPDDATADDGADDGAGEETILVRRTAGTERRDEADPDQRAAIERKDELVGDDRA
jgi:hypothetical protein